MLNQAAPDRFAEIESSGASGKVITRLRALVDGSEELDCWKINAFRIADEAGVPRVEAVRALLFATRVGLFDLNWDVYCPSCGGSSEFHKSLMGLKDQSHCPACVVDFSVQFDEQVEVTFTVNPDVRRLAILQSEQTLEQAMQSFMARAEREGRKQAPKHNWVSAAYLSTQQDFRDLFAGEFLSPEASFAVRSVTLMFSDIRGSTEMYESLGDARAYTIVKEHFALMTEIIRKHEGGVVKTIGDAVMAAFPVNADAVKAAIEIQRAFASTADPLRTVEVKIGLHRGPAIVVTSNRAVDYFGRTVNVAARAQGAAQPRQVLLTDQVIGDPLVRALVEQLPEPASSFEAKVKGVARPLRLHALRCI